VLQGSRKDLELLQQFRLFGGGVLPEMTYLSFSNVNSGLLDHGLNSLNTAGAPSTGTFHKRYSHDDLLRFSGIMGSRFPFWARGCDADRADVRGQVADTIFSFITYSFEAEATGGRGANGDDPPSLRF
jgi:hypothetical protein